MIHQFSLYNESEMKEWDEFVKSHPDGTPFHLSGWLKSIKETYGFEPFLYVIKDSENKISGIFPIFFIKTILIGKREVSIPFSDYGGPLCLASDDESNFIKFILEKKDSLKYIEIRGKLTQKFGFVQHSYYKRHVLELLPDPPKILKKIDKRTVQYSIRKAKRSGVKICEENSVQGILEFYRLNKLTRIKHGVPLQPKKFFECIFENLILKGDGTIFLAIYNEKVISGGIFLKCGNKLYYKYNVSDPELIAKVTPNHLLTWNAIEKASLEGYQSIDFGRSSPDNAGLMRYKEMWGAKPIELPYNYFPKIKGAVSTEENSLTYRFLTKIWQSLPDKVTDKIGPKIYRNFA